VQRGTRQRQMPWDKNAAYFMLVTIVEEWQRKRSSYAG